MSCPICGGVSACPAPAGEQFGSLADLGLSAGWSPPLAGSMGGIDGAARGFRRLDWRRLPDIPAGWSWETTGSAGAGRVQDHNPDAVAHWVSQCTYLIAVGAAPVGASPANNPFTALRGKF